MKIFIAKYKKIMIVFLVLAVVTGIYFWISRLNVEGRLVSYTKVDQTYEFEYAYCQPEQLLSEEYADFNMTKEEIEDVRNNPDDYDSYFIDYYINNISGHMLFDLSAGLDKGNKNLWLDGILNKVTYIEIKDNEMFDHNRLWLIVKTKGMSDNDIDRLIKSIGIVFRAAEVDIIAIYASKTLYFN